MEEFKSQADCWRALLEGKTLKDTLNGLTYKMHNDNMCYWNNSRQEWIAAMSRFTHPQNYKIKKEIVKKSRTVWINVYPTTNYLHETKAAADRGTPVGKLACIETKLEWEEEV